MNDQIPVKDITPVKIHQPESSKHNNQYTPRSHIYVRAVKGALDTFRRTFGFFFLGMFALLPWLQFNGQQAILFDLAEQRFTIFNLTLWPQDLTLLAWIFIVAAYALFFVTTFAGRVWCGFMCPQTTWTFIFIWFEEVFEGNRNKRIKLDERKMDFDKFWRKSAKHLSWVIVSLLTALTFVGYFAPIRELFVDFFTLQTGFWITVWTLFFALCTYGNAGWLREIMCTHICPYARFQSVMFDKDTLTVTYDAARGESRGPRSRKMDKETREQKNIGDCVDCNLCVQVCPTGIDIRNGLQYECIDCGKCIDACNDTMDKMKYERGLIRFTSESELAGGKSHILRPKLVGYAVVLLVMVALLCLELFTRVPLAVDIIRDRNSLYRETNDGLIENVYTLKILNKSQFEQQYQISVSGLTDPRITGEQTISVKGGEVFTLPISVAVDPYSIKETVTNITFDVQAINAGEQDVVQHESSKFLYPDL
ncbi:cytochrome c oxidase accessory protein CcoG [Neptunicella marina]|uniref:Cytochrome c oxidase accessory protein CcoG n=1 Tax=Neptunicella marina TaxID=2125989 RepID=A0A8J6ITY2_9ALTE|nr:cytochrome c oxidase accessory protein CcoG [Neptunicella marina]MBC3765747.1 cytochrome c oxidase accessory protein CcoG [Neptunicella marina]